MAQMIEQGNLIKLFFAKCQRNLARIEELKKNERQYREKLKKIQKTHNDKFIYGKKETGIPQSRKKVPEPIKQELFKKLI